MIALEYVIRRHRIDPLRVYLTGHGRGGDGVWRLAEAHPVKWAALPRLVLTSLRTCKKFGTSLPGFSPGPGQGYPVERQRILVHRLNEARAMCATRRSQPKLA